MAKPRGKTVQLHNMFVADFETGDSQKTYKVDKITGEEIKYQKVWLAGYKNLQTMKSTYFNNADDFMRDILARHENTNREYAFHNLKFDGSFIVPWLFENGYTVALGKPAPGEFSPLVDDRNNWYSITIQVTTKRKVTLWDSLKLFPTALEYLPDIYSTPTKKIREDQDFYTKERPEGYEPDDRDLAYFENDLQVPAETLNKHIELYGLRFKKTQASQSFYNFEQTFKAWRWRFPALDNEVDEVVRPAYWGGISHVPKHKAEKDYYDIHSYDINSSYPDKAANYKLPHGKPVHEFGEGKHPDMSKFWIAEALVKFKLKDQDKLPCIPSKAIMEGRPLVVDKWMVDSGYGGDNIVKIRFCNIDYQTIQESYEFEVVRWCWSIHWAWKKQREIAKFVNMNNDLKVKYSELAAKEKDPQKKVEYKTIRNRAKIDNNSFYGKFGEEVIKQGKTPHYEEDEEGNEEIVWKTDREDEQSEYNRKFLPVAIAITAWGRQQLVKMANLLGEHFLYCDTDSVHFLKEGQSKIDKAIKGGELEVHPTKLGAWDFEGYYVRGRYLRAKAYMEEKENGEIEVTLAGLPADKHSGAFSKKRSAISWDDEKKCNTWDKFHIGHIVPAEKSNKLRTVRTPTGNKLVPVGFQIKHKDTALNTVPTQEQLDKVMEKQATAIIEESDPIKEAVKNHGYIKIPAKDDLFYPEYRELNRSTIMKYFRKKGIPFDNFADIIGENVSELWEKLQIL